MSQTLTPDAPSQDLAADPQGTPAPTSGGEVAVGSAGGGDFIEKARFDGLMSSYNKTKNELEGRLAAATQEIDSLRAAQEQNGPQVSQTNDIAGLQEQVGQLSQLLVKQQIESATKDALEKYPEAKPLADLIVGNSPEEIEDVARTIADRLKGISAGAPDPEVEPVVDPQVNPEVKPEITPVAPVVGGGTAAPDTEALVTKKAEALASGNLGAFLEAAWEEQQTAVIPTQVS